MDDQYTLGARREESSVRNFGEHSHTGGVTELTAAALIVMIGMSVIKVTWEIGPIETTGKDPHETTPDGRDYSMLETTAGINCSKKRL